MARSAWPSAPCIIRRGFIWLCGVAWLHRRHQFVRLRADEIYFDTSMLSYSAERIAASALLRRKAVVSAREVIAAWRPIRMRGIFRYCGRQS